MQNDTKLTKQYIANRSFDPTFNMSQMELLGFDSVNNVLRPIKVDANGQVYVSGALSQTAADLLYEKLSNLRTSFQVTPDDTHYISEKLAKDSLDGKQATLVSGTNIKTVGSTSLLGSGDVPFPTSLLGLNNTWTGTNYISTSNVAAFKVGTTPNFQVDTVNGLVGVNTAPSAGNVLKRSEERRVGKECQPRCRSRWSPYH